MIHLPSIFIMPPHKGEGGLMDKVSALQPRDRGFEPHTGHNHDSSYDISTGWFQEAGSRDFKKLRELASQSS